ncbi:hypothetical protein R3P38DRAFT_3195728 [Favolaschia claudopus]|uniref:Uncharacterized protein n=1 Tax=Favolaschia claudopus TaxID=2862362 RepID=A0AAW0BBR6_9AGAR
MSHDPALDTPRSWVGLRIASKPSSYDFSQLDLARPSSSPVTNALRRPVRRYHCMVTLLLLRLARLPASTTFTCMIALLPPVPPLRESLDVEADPRRLFSSYTSSFTQTYPPTFSLDFAISHFTFRRRPGSGNLLL